MNDTTDLMSQWQQNKAKWEQLCNEQESIYRPEFETVFAKLFEIHPDQREVYKTHLWNVDQPLPEATDTNKIDQALQAVGATDEVAERFKQYAEITLQGKRLMQQNTLLNMAMEMAKRPQKTHSEGWRFMPIHILAPRSLHTTIKDELHRQAKEGDGLFKNITYIPESDLPDEFLDNLLGVEVYNIKCDFGHYLDEVKYYKINSRLLGKTLTRRLFEILKDIADYIKANTDHREAIRAKILDVTTVFDSLPNWGLIFQILILQGLIDLLENCSLNEGDDGFNEAQSLYDWLIRLLIPKIFILIYKPYSDDDQEFLQPLCSYLYATKLGRAIQDKLFNSNTNVTAGLRLPDEFNTDRARKYFARGVDRPKRRQ